MATPTIRRRKNCRTLRSCDGLIKYARNNTSQNGEDGIIARIFNELLPPSPQGFCVDVGAWDGVHHSNTYSLLVDDKSNPDGNKSKWNGVLIEADPDRTTDLKKLHNPLNNICIGAKVSCQKNSPRSLTSLLRCHAPDLPFDFDFISIDVDGTDYWLLADMIANNNHEHAGYYRPKVICIEFNPTMPNDLIYIQPRDDNIRHGSSLSALVELANSVGYTLVETTVLNAFFVEQKLYEEYLMKEVPDTSIEVLHDISMGTELYQLYDGTLKLHGCEKMLSRPSLIDEKKMQMLSEKEIRFPVASAGVDDLPPNGRGNNNPNQTQISATDMHAANLKSKQIREMAIDISSYCIPSDEDNQNEERKRECFTKLNETLRTDGFALVRGTGISGSLCNSALQAAKSFFHQTDESVRRSCLTKDRARRGYSPMCTENFASLVGKQGPNDLVKKYRIGPESNSKDLDDNTESNVRSLSSLHQANAWPTEETWGHEHSSAFKSSIKEYFERTCNAADCILEAICDGIIARNMDVSESIQAISQSTRSQKESSNETNEKSHTSILTLLGYQPGSRHKKGSKGYLRPLISAHTDVGVITMLHFDDGKCASLQRAADATNTDPENNNWVDVDLPPILDEDPIFVVNVGDCLSELSGGSLRSTLHRVMPIPCSKEDDDVARTCLALFVGLEPSASLTLPSGEVLSYEKWRQQRIARAAAVLKNSS